MTKEKFDIYGMSCSACSSRIQSGICKMNGVDKAEVNLLSNTMNVEYDESVLSDISIMDEVRALGYDAKLHTNEISKENKKRSDIQLKKLIVSICLLIPLMFFSMAHMFGIMIDDTVTLIIVSVLTLAIIIINNRYFVSGFKGLFRLSPNMDTLIALGATASVLYSIYLIIFTKDYMHNLYFDSAAMILTFVSVGKYFESRSKSKTTDAISKLMDLSPDNTLIMVDGKEKLISTDDVKKGDHVILKAGYRISIDGIVIEGDGYTDESPLTGESMPVEKEKGSTVYCGTTVTSGYLIVEALSVKGETKLSKIIELVEEASSSKAPISKIADKVSLVFVPCIILIALIVLAIWSFTVGDINLAFNFAICVLVISCPCALGLATPTAIMVGTGKAAQYGILIKSSESLELLAKTKNIVFDKTGTITSGKPSVIDVKVCSKTDRTEILKIASSLEKLSDHPLSKAVTDAYKNDDLYEISDFESVTGNGISGIINNKRYFIGKYKYIQENTVNSIERSLEHKTATPLYLSDSDDIIGIIYISDEIKKSSISAIKRLNELGIETYMLTGDNSEVASHVKEITGVRNVKADLLPDDKEAYIKLLKGTGTTVMVGDGINDSPALVSSDVGIAIGAGTDIAIDSADVILIRNDLADIVTAIELSKKTVKNIKENLFWAFIYNLICIPLAAGAFYIPFGIKLSPMIGTVAMSLSSICVVSNALRLKRFKPSINNSDNENIKENKTAMKTVYIEGMMCMHCKAHVENALKELGCDPIVSLENNTAVINEDIDNEKITAAIENAGYKVTDIK